MLTLLQNIWLSIFGLSKLESLMSSKLDTIIQGQNQLNNAVTAILQALPQLMSQKQLIDLLQAVLSKEGDIESLLAKIQADLLPLPAVKLVLKLGGGIHRGTNGMLQIADSGSLVNASLEADDALGNAGAELDAAPQWSVSDASLASIAPSADGMSAVVTPAGKLGTFTIGVTAVAGGQALSAVSDSIQVAVGAAASLKVSLTAVAAPVAAPAQPAAPSA